MARSTNKRYGTRSTSRTPTKTSQSTIPSIFQKGRSTFSNIMENAASIAIGHTISHSILNFIWPRSTVPTQQIPNQDISKSNPEVYSESQFESNTCNTHLDQFLNCLQKNNQNLNACEYYMNMLKDCRSNVNVDPIVSTW